MALATFSLDIQSVEEVLDYPVLVSRFEQQSEQRRLKVSKKVIGFKCQGPNCIKSEMQEYRAFYVARSGALDGFYYTSPFDDEQYTVRFAPGSFKAQYSGGTFKVSWNFQVINEDEA